VQSVDEPNRATTAHIAAIDHSPWNDDRGKGAIDLDWAIELSFVVNVQGQRTGQGVHPVLQAGGSAFEAGPFNISIQKQFRA
jgi:hypothetical protein